MNAIAEVLDLPYVQAGLNDLSEEHALTKEVVRRRADRSLREMWTVHQPWVSEGWARFGKLLTSRYELRMDSKRFARVADLDARHPMIYLFSHRSYLDLWLLREAVERVKIAPIHGLAGANLNFWPVGSILRRTGALFIRRETKGDPIYRFVLRAYIRYLLDTGKNLGWSIEGGRTRTGKLRPPRFGALRYVVDAVRHSEGPEAYVVPVSVVYEQLGEVATMTAEALGGSKKPENLRWLAKFALMQRNQGGEVRIDCGEPVPLREQIQEFDQGARGPEKTVERIAVDVCHRINSITPATASGLVAVGLLGEGRGLTLEELEQGVDPILTHLKRRPEHAYILDPRLSEERGWIKETVEALTTSGVVERYDGGETPVFRIAPGQHLVAAFYRNTLIHFLVARAIGELSMSMAKDHQGDLRQEIWERALRIRDLLKFEFFFPRRRDFEQLLMAEIDRIDPDWEGRKAALPVITQEQVGLWFERSRPQLAHIVLRPFFDAYHLVAQQLAKEPPDVAVEKDAFLQRVLGVGWQWVFQHRIHSEESVTLEIFKNAFQLATHLGLVQPGEGVKERRQALAEELAEICDALSQLAEVQHRRRP